MNYSYTLLYTLRRCISVQLETPNARCYYMIILLYFFTFYPRIYTQIHYSVNDNQFQYHYHSTHNGKIITIQSQTSSRKEEAIR